MEKCQKNSAEQAGIKLDLGQNKIENLIKLSSKNLIIEDFLRRIDKYTFL